MNIYAVIILVCSAVIIGTFVALKLVRANKYKAPECAGNKKELRPRKAAGIDINV